MRNPKYPYAATLPDPVTIECDLYQRRGRYRLARLFEIAGTDEPTTAHHRLAAALGCPRAQRQFASRPELVWDDRCKARYVIAQDDLA